MRSKLTCTPVLLSTSMNRCNAISSESLSNAIANCDFLMLMLGFLWSSTQARHIPVSIAAMDERFLEMQHVPLVERSTDFCDALSVNLLPSELDLQSFGQMQRPSQGGVSWLRSSFNCLRAFLKSMLGLLRHCAQSRNIMNDFLSCC